MRMRPFGRLISADEAVRRLVRATRPVNRTEIVGTSEALGRVTSRGVRAPVNVPAFRRATWDGYAFASRSSRGASPSRPVRLHVVGEVFAEEGYERPLGPREAIAVATGAALPKSANTVIIFEEAARDGLDLSLRRFVPPGERIAEPGEDLRTGQLVVDREEVLSPAALGALAAVGLSKLECFARPTVAIVPNGNELAVAGEHLAPGAIFESNNSSLAGLIEASGATALTFRPVPDDPTAIEAALACALKESDMVISTGGSSVGEHDFLPDIFPRLGKLLFHGVAVRPGKPTLAASVGEKMLVGMPGHPTSCLLNSFWLLLPALRRLSHRKGPGWMDIEVQLTRAPIRPTPGFTTVVPLQVEAGLATPTFHDSSAITSLLHANAFAILPPKSTPLRKGSKVQAHWLPPPVGWGVPSGARASRRRSAG